MADNFFKVIDTKEGIDFGDLFPQLILVPFRKAAHNIYIFNEICLLGGDILKNGIDGFLFGIVDKPAGIDDGGIDPGVI